MKKQFATFAVIGCIGFAVDAISFLCFDYFLRDPYIARLFSYVCAATATWSLNRVFTFKLQFGDFSITHLVQEWAKFLVSQTAGFAVNYGTFSLLVYHFEFFLRYEVVAIGIGSIAGLFLNFFVAKFIVFKQHH